MTTKKERIVRVRLAPNSRLRRVRGSRSAATGSRAASWREFDAMTPEEVWVASLSDPDAQPLTARELKEFKPVGPPRRIDVAALRKRLKMSQTAFAARFGLDVSAVHAWEQGRRQPDRAARVLLTVIDREPAAVLRALARTK
jgi:putative transcriptional regulator